MQNIDCIDSQSWIADAASYPRSRCSTDVDIRSRDRDVNYSLRLGRLAEEQFASPHLLQVSTLSRLER